MGKPKIRPLPTESKPIEIKNRLRRTTKQ